MKNVMMWKTLVGAGLVALAVQNAGAEDGKRGPGPMRGKIMEKFDKDGDGKLSEEERDAAREAMEKHRGKHGGPGPRLPPAMKQEILEKFDAGKDGQLSEAEREAARAAMREKMTAKFDKDGDGKLSDEERSAAREEFRDRHPGPGPRGKGAGADDN